MPITTTPEDGEPLAIPDGGSPSGARSRIDLIRSVGWAFVGRVGLTMSGVLMTVFTARLLAPDERGVLVLAILTGVFVGLLPKSVASALAYQRARPLSHGSESRTAVVADSWTVAAVFAFGTGVPVAAAAGIASAQMGWGPVGLIIVTGSALASLSSSIPLGLSLADGRMGRWAVAFAGSQVGALIGTVGALALWDDSLSPAAIGWSGGALLGGVVSNDRTSVTALVRRARGRTRRSQARFSLKASGAAVLNTAAGRSDIALLGVLDGARAVGIYSVAVGASELVWFLGNSLATAEYGRVGRLDEAAARRVTWRVSRVAIGLAAAQAIPLALIAHPAMEFVFGPEFRVSGDYLIVLLLGAVVGSPLMAIVNYFTNQLGRPAMSFLFAVVMLSVTAVTCLILIPEFGATGAAIGSSAGYLSGILLAAAALWKVGRSLERPGSQ